MIWWILGYFVIGVIILVTLRTITTNQLMRSEFKDYIISMAIESKTMKISDKTIDVWPMVLDVIIWPVASIYMMMFNRAIKRILQGECEKKTDHDGSENT